MPTVDSAKTHLLMQYLYQANTSVLFIGASGSAKTSSVLLYSSKLGQQGMLFHRINFSSATQPV